ncbi:hypothetical protein ACFFRR_009499, partial [Megaselia abdita]
YNFLLVEFTSPTEQPTSLAENISRKDNRTEMRRLHLLFLALLLHNVIQTKGYSSSPITYSADTSVTTSVATTPSSDTKGLTQPNEGSELDSESSKKNIGSSVVTSVSVILNGDEKPQFTDAVGKKVPKPAAPIVASPIDLLNPDRYEFYTFDDNGELVKRLMTMQEIQSIVANGDGEGPAIIHTMTLDDKDPEKNVHDIVASVQNVLTKEVEDNKNNTNATPIFDTPDVSASWAQILPAIFGNTGGSIFPQSRPQQVVMTPDSDVVEATTKPHKPRPKPSKKKPSKKKPTTSRPIALEIESDLIDPDNKPPSDITAEDFMAPTPQKIFINNEEVLVSTTKKPKRPKPTRKTTTSDGTATKFIKRKKTTTKAPVTEVYVAVETTTPKVTKRKKTTTKAPTVISSTTTISTTTEEEKQSIVETTTRKTTKPKKTTLVPKTKTEAPISATTERLSVEITTAKVTKKPKPSKKKTTTTSTTSTTTTTTTEMPRTTISSYTTTTTTTTPSPSTLRSVITKATTPRPRPVSTTVSPQSESVELPSPVKFQNYMDSGIVPLLHRPPSTAAPPKQPPSYMTTFEPLESAEIVSKYPNLAVETTLITDNPEDTNTKLSFNQIMQSLTQELEKDEDILGMENKKQTIPGKVDPLSEDSSENVAETSQIQKVEPFIVEEKTEITTEVPESTTAYDESEETTLRSEISESNEKLYSESSEKNYSEEVEEEATTRSPIVQEVDEYIESNRPDMPDMVDIDPGYLNADFEIPEQTAGEHVTAGSNYMSGFPMMHYNENESKDTLEDSDENTEEIDSLMSNFLNQMNEKDSSNRLSDISSMNESFFNDITTEKFEETTTSLPDLEKRPKDEPNANYEEEIQITTEQSFQTESPEPTTIKTFEEVTAYSPEITTQKPYLEQTTLLASSEESTEGETSVVLTDSDMEESTEKFETTIDTTEHISYNVEPEEAYLKLGENFPKTSSSSTTTTTTEAPSTAAKTLPNTRKPQPYHRPSLEIKRKPVVYSANNLNKPMVRPATLNNLQVVKPSRPPVKLDPTPNSSLGLEASTLGLEDDIMQFSHLCNELAFSYWRAITSEKISSARSLIISPFALTSTLSMVFLGARGGTSGEMNEILKLDDMVTFNPHLVFKNVTDSVERAEDSDIASTSFVREIYSDRGNGKILQFFKEKIQQLYGGHVEEVNFNVVNDIIRRRTNVLVKRHSLGKVAEYLRTNSVWVNGPLATISANLFQTDCSKGSIHDRDGEMFFQVHPSIRQRRLVPIPAVVYKSGFTAGYYPELDATIVAFGNIKDTVSTIYVMPGQQGTAAPGDNLDRLEKTLIETAITKNSWNHLLNTLVERPGLEVQLPRFSHRSFINASLGLQKMGLKGLFNSDYADLTGLTGSANKDVHLSDVIQINTFSTCAEDKIGEHHHVEMYPAPPLRKRNTEVIDNDYDSSESVLDSGKSFQTDASGRGFYDDLLEPKYQELPLPLRPRQARIPDAPRLRFDKPFMYFVRHNPTGMILFMGRFNPRLLP